ncbi:MAG: hypothetical protein IPH03_17045 [Tetrasphaera sp.]|nr:hypothetical protein [Tetrasphaera sp.]
MAFETLDISARRDTDAHRDGASRRRGQEGLTSHALNVQASYLYQLPLPARQSAESVVLGTGDLSELALGWCTYGVGDEMSHFSTRWQLERPQDPHMRHPIRWVVSSGQFAAAVSTILGPSPTPGLPELNLKVKVKP